MEEMSRGEFKVADIKNHAIQKLGKENAEELFAQIEDEVRSKIKQATPKPPIPDKPVYIEKHPAGQHDIREIQKMIEFQEMFEKVELFVEGYKGTPDYKFLKKRLEYYKLNFLPIFIISMLKADLEFKPINDGPVDQGEIAVHDDPKNYVRSIDIRGFLNK